MAGDVIPIFGKREKQIVAEAGPAECSDDEKTGPLTHEQINHIHHLTGELADTDDVPYVVELMGRIRQEVAEWPDG